MPFSAPLPVPTMMAVGVARPMAHGQAMTSQHRHHVDQCAGENAQSFHLDRNPGNKEPKDKGQKCQEDDRGDKNIGHLVSQLLNGGFTALGLFHQFDDLGKRGFAADLDRFKFD